MTVKFKLEPVLPVLYHGAYLTFGLACAAVYLKTPIEAGVMLTSFLLGASVYAINRFTDPEDLLNDPDTRILFANNSWGLVLAVAGLVLSLIWLLLTAKLTPFHLVVVVAGLAYSLKILPWLDRNMRVSLIRLKDLTFAKSLTVAFVMGSWFFALNWFLYPDIVGSQANVFVLALGCTIMIFVNTNFCDILDVDGDRASGIPTIPAKYGVRATLWSTAVAPTVAWLGLILALVLTKTIPGEMASFLVIVAVFPLAYILPFLLNKTASRRLKFIADADLLVFSVGLLTLHAVG